VVVDPRRTETAEGADAHYFIRPGTDAYFLLAMIHTMFTEGLDRPGRLKAFTEGSAEVRRLAADWTPERAAPLTGIDPPAIRRVAREFAQAPSAVSYGRMGTCVQEFGAAAPWLADVVNVITGNLDRPGGAMFTTPAVDVRRVASLLGQSGSHGKWRSRVGGFAEVGGEFPVAAFAEEMETPGPGRIRGLVVHAGNPVLSLPNGGRIDRALGDLEFMVAVDLYLNETTRHADVILPTAFGFEHDTYALLTANAAVRNSARYGPKLMDAPEGVREDHWILTELTARLLARRGALGRAAAAAARAFDRRVGPRGMLRAGLRFGPHGKGLLGDGLTLGALERRPEGVDLGPLEPRMPKLLFTKDRRIHLAPPPMVADLARLEAREMVLRDVTT
ncbi:MAG: molybdopterin-dependent oxidoreductase, partial [Myxococcales bacterium]|nr:molybdopterin-dependent oxidoreductase [Myxococcales bacterium]